MSGPLHFAPLGSGDAPLIGALQRRLFAPELTESDAYIAGILRNTEQHMVCNMSYGLFEGTQLVGYVFAYVESESIFFARPEEVIYLKEIALLPGYEAQMRSLFSRLFMQWHAFTPRMSLEAHALEEALGNWRRLERAFRFYGLQLQVREETAQAGRPPYRLMRMDPAPDAQALLQRHSPLPAERIALGDGTEACVVTSPRQWLGLAARWEQLRQETPGASAQQAFEDLREWWNCHGIWSELHIVVLVRGDAVIGIAPLMLRHVRSGGVVLRRLQLLGSPGFVSDGVLVFGNDPEALAVQLCAALAATAQDWDVLELTARGASAQAQALRAQARHHGWLPVERASRLRVVDPAAAGPPGSTLVRRIEGWPALEAGLGMHGAVEEEGGHPGEDRVLGNDRANFFLFRALAARSGAGARLIQHVAERGGRVVGSRIGLMGSNSFRVLRAAHVPGAAAEAQDLEYAEARFLAGTGCRCIEYGTVTPQGASQAVRLQRLQIFQPQHGRAARRAVWHERLATLVDAVAWRGAGRGLARRLRS